MNLIIIILAGITAYILTCLYAVINGLIARKMLSREQKKRYSNDLYKHKVKKILFEAYHLGLESGLSEDDAYRMAACYTKEVENAFMVDVKYKLLKGA